MRRPARSSRPFQAWSLGIAIARRQPPKSKRLRILQSEAMSCALRLRTVSSSTFSPTMPKSTTPSITSPGISSSRTLRNSTGRFSATAKRRCPLRRTRMPQRSISSSESSARRPLFCSAIRRRFDSVIFSFPFLLNFSMYDIVEGDYQAKKNPRKFLAYRGFDCEMCVTLFAVPTEAIFEGLPREHA